MNVERLVTKMKRKLFAFLSTLAIAFTASSAMAQSTGYLSGHQGQSHYGFGGSGYYRSSSVAEGYLTGWGRYVHALGTYNLNSSLAAINLQEARRLAIENRQQAVTSYFELRQRNQNFRDMNRKPRLTMEELARVNKAMIPDRLSTQQFEPATRTIFWPASLKGPDFAEERLAIEQEFAKRGEVPTGIGSDNHLEIREAAASIRGKLSEQIAEMRPEDYIAAKKFLDSVTYESRFAENTSGVAANR